ncbi:chromosome condensation protein [Plasmodium gonderi]|uniref:Structural maintenance of chromosomes protein n=1 Tax=Plasmodium gonderi TaxID=77519 RepID=A0A1Y1JN37_PLAGO|nr:chromosome condensation protein [Plasmodium gonderi]GAW81464.1 chromosome condensation protein [Plasmodium gonderi]
MRDVLNVVETKAFLSSSGEDDEQRNSKMLSIMNEDMVDVHSTAVEEKGVKKDINKYSVSVEKKQKNTRIIIDKLILENFKSYSGVKVIGPFYKKFSCIVGPNGSGKSNIIDAMLFVFGRRAKKIRQNKLCDLIHSSKYSMNNEYTKVSIYFKVVKVGENFEQSGQSGQSKQSEQMEQSEQSGQPGQPDKKRKTSVNTDLVISDTLPEEEDESFIISREATVDNQSRYRINDRVVSQKEVFDLLYEKGIDLNNNRFLILQGEVEQISQMNPKGNKNEEGLLEYLEEIIGTNSYIENINKSSEELEKCEEVYHDKMNRLKHVYNELKELAGPKKEAKYYVDLQKYTHKLNIIILKKENHDLAKMMIHKKEELEAYLKKKEEHNEIYTNLLRERKDMNTILSSLENEESEIMKRKNKTDNEFKKLTIHDENVKKELLIIVEKMQNLYVKREKLKEKDIPRYKNIIEAKQKILNEIKREKIPKLERELEKCEEELEKYNEEIKSETNKINTIYSKEEEKLAPLQNSYDTLIKLTSEYTNRCNIIEKKQREFLTHVENLKYLQSKLLNELKEKDIQSKHMMNLDQEKKKIMQSKDAQVAELDHQIETVMNTLVDLNVKYETMKKDVTSDKSLNKMHEFIYNLKKNKIKGIHGILGDLGYIDKKYEKAFLIAGNNCTDFVIVENPNDAILLFEHMRKQNIGRVNVLSLSILESNLMPIMKKNEQNYTPLLPNVHRLVDFVKFKHEKYKVCFYYALKETLVANTLEEAHVIGYSHKRRVVTLAGELIENDGRICGGGILNNQAKLLGYGKVNGRKSYNKPSTIEGDPDNLQMERNNRDSCSNFFKRTEEEKYDEVDVTKTENAIKEMNKNMDELKKRKENMLSDIKDLRTLVEDNECKLEIANKRIDNCKKQLKDIDEQLKNSQVPELTKEEKTELESLKELIEEKNNEKNKIEIILKAQENKVKMYYEQLQNVGGEKKKNLKNKKIHAERQLNITKDEIEKHNSEEVNALANLQKGEKDILKFTDEIEEYEKNEKELENELKDVEVKGCAIYQETEKLTKELAEIQAKIQHNQKKKQQIDETVSKKDLENVDIVYKIENIQKEIEQLNLRRGTYEAKIMEYTQLIHQVDQTILENMPCRVRQSANYQDKCRGEADEEEEGDSEDSLDYQDEESTWDEESIVDDRLEDHHSEETHSIGGKRKLCLMDNHDNKKKKEEESISGDRSNEGEEEEPDKLENREKKNQVIKRKRRKSAEDEDEEQEEELKALEDMSYVKEEWSDMENEYDYLNMKEEELDALNKKEIESKLESKLRILEKKSPNLKVFQDYNVKLYDYMKRRKDVKKSKKQKDKIKKVYDNLCNKRRKEFLIAFNIISSKLKEMYQMIAIGGDAELEIIDSSEIFNEGILFSVRPPKKSWKHIQNLSGGEKTLSSLALVFALHYFKPNPIYFMDEIDAALDFKNVSIISHYIKTKTSDAQFIVVSLRNQMFELCDRMIGIYKTNDITKCITLNPSKFQLHHQNTQETETEAEVEKKEF